LRGTHWLLILSLIALLMPNSNQIGERVLAQTRSHVALAASGLGAALTCCIFFVLINNARDSVSAFIYFNF
jgi:hypothetical protein